MVVGPELRFRRHLATCILLILVQHSAWQHEQYRRVRLASAQSSDFAINKHHQRQNQHQPHQQLQASSGGYGAAGMVDQLGGGVSSGGGGIGGDQYGARFARLQQQQQQQQQQESSNNNNDNLMMRTSLVNDDDDDNIDLIAYALDFVGYYLPTLNFNYTLLTKEFDNHQLDAEVERYYRQQFASNMSLDQLQLASIKASLRTAPMPIHFSWGYANRVELRQGSLPVQDDARCIAHLAQLSQRLDKITTSSVQANGALNLDPSMASTILGVGVGGGSNSNSNSVASNAALGSLASIPPSAAHESSPVENFEAAQLYKSTDLQFFRYLDTFGHVPTDALRGNMRWYGSYSGCLDTKLRANPAMGGTKRIKFRYCMGALKSVTWTSTTNNTFQRGAKARAQARQFVNTYGVHSKDIQMENYFIRIGVCLPESCDSSALDYQENWHNIEKLIKFNLMKPYNSDHYYLSDLYCLPDQRSPLRTIPIMGKLLILGTLAWLSLVGLATMVHLNVERFYRKAVKEIRKKEDGNTLTGLDSGAGSNDSLNPKINQSSSNKRNAPSSPSPSRSSSSSDNNNNNNNNNEFPESDILGLKRIWIRLNVYIWDLSKKLIKGVDLIACLSLYSNWLKYTSRLKAAIVELHADEERRERISQRNQKLVDEARGQTNFKNGGGGSGGGGGGQVSFRSNKLSGEGEDESKTKAKLTGSQQIEQDRQMFDNELDRRLKAQDDSDEFDSVNVKRRVDTSSLNALKVVAMFWIIAGHCVFYLGSTISNGAILMNYVRDLAGFALANGAIYITELFFVITGCLTAYLAFKYNTIVPKSSSSSSSSSSSPSTHTDGMRTKEGERKHQVAYMESRLFKIPFWLMICANRYLRILPTYLLVYSYVKLVSIYIGGHGQTWDYAVSPNSMRRECQLESWFPVLTLTTNYVDIYNHCIVGGWYLSADMQFMIMAVPILIMMAYLQRRTRSRSSSSKNHNQFVAFSKQSQQINQLTIETGNNNINLEQSGSFNEFNYQILAKNEILISKRILFGYVVIFGIGLISAIVSMFYGIFKSEVDFAYILKFVPHTVAMLSRNIAMYTNSLLRLRAFVFGLILGHLLYLYEFKLIKLPKFIQLHGAKITTIVFTIGFSIMFLPILWPQNKLIVSHDLTAILMILSAGGIDLFLCILIFLICIGKAPKVILFLLNSPFWTVLSSLSLCAFLVHTEIIILLTSLLNPPPTVQYSLLLFVFSSTLILTYILALALYLSFEMPVSRLIEALMRKYLSNSKLVRSDNPNGKSNIGNTNNNTPTADQTSTTGVGGVIGGSSGGKQNGRKQ